MTILSHKHLKQIHMNGFFSRSLFITMHNKAFSLFLNLSFIFLLSFYTFSTFSHQPNHPIYVHEIKNSIGKCNGVYKLSDYKSKCLYVKSHTSCSNKGYLNYLEIYYCSCNGSQFIGYLVLILCLVILFYVLGNTTSEYFIPSVEGLSIVLKLSPTIAGTTLLPLGNGANDVFASIISFTRSGDGDVGLNSVLGGALFISCFVVGILSISISSRKIRVDEVSFIRDVLFLLFTLSCLLVIIIFEVVNLWFALCFVSIYFIYIGVVSLMQYFRGKDENSVKSQESEEIDSMISPLLGYVDEEKGYVWEKNGLIGSDRSDEAHHSFSDRENPNIGYRCPSRKCLGSETKTGNSASFFQIIYQKSGLNYRAINWNMILYILELPLYLPRRLTIPIVSEEKWSKPFAIISSTLAPILLATICNEQVGNNDTIISLVIYLTAIFVGIILGTLALFFTEKSDPPKRFLYVWLSGGFLMSIIWTYIIVEELVSLLITFGIILGINPSILGLTVLAWGNSVGDLISNFAMALKDGKDGAQVAISGCYAGPLFNTLIGLGLSLVLGSWVEYPMGYRVITDSEIYETVGFLMMGLLWALVILPKRKMQVDKYLGVGLLSIYLCFLFLRLVKGVGLI